jgi:diadenosine tetraphosphatase ApaH/serine/threonine PP2A family protein phosphatase
MTIALLTDIHSNREALEACLLHADAHGATRYIFLGDFVGYGADPVWVVDTVMDHAARGAIVVRGNHDEATAGPGEVQMNDDAQACVHWTRLQLRPEQLEFLCGLPLSRQEGNCLYVHANGWDPQGYEYIHGPMQAARSIQAVSARITFCGHMHDPMLYHMGLTQRVEEFAPVPETAIPLSAARRWVAIPGSVGQPRDGNPAASYATYDEFNSLLTFWRIPYDHETAARKIRGAALPERYARQLQLGA